MYNRRKKNLVIKSKTFATGKILLIQKDKNSFSEDKL